MRTGLVVRSCPNQRLSQYLMGYDAQCLAKEDGVSLNQRIAVAVAEKVGVVETVAQFFKKRAGKVTGRAP
jgi:hypothetical protein